jgi:Tol biopolymer transport system component
LKQVPIFFICFLILFSLLNAQEFGKNKIQYKNFNWKHVKTPHFTIYYYQGEEELVKFAAQVAEDSYYQIKEDLSHTFRKRVPLIIYNSHNDFEQTNVTLSLLEESVGGFTEIFKNRMVVPFEGSYERFRHVINHELVHAFQFDILLGSKLGSVLQSELLMSIPLWFVEGLAEYESLNWESETESYMRDAVINDRLIPIQVLNYYGGYASYKEGQSIYKYVSTTYGRKKIGELLHTMKQKKDLEKALKSTLGLTVEQLNEEWTKSLKKKYWILYDQKEEIDVFATRLTNHVRMQNAYNVSPSISPDGTRIAFITDREEYTEILIISAINGQVLKKIVQGTKSATFESLHILRPGISWSDEGNLITFAAKSGKEDVIFVVDVETGNIISKLHVDCDGVYSPNFSPDGRTIVFSGIKDGFPDIYTISTETHDVQRLTHDLYDDRDPVFSPYGDCIVFSSDRESLSDTIWHYGNYALFKYSLYDNSIEQLTEREYELGNPVFSGDGEKIVFTSDREGVSNLYILDLDSLTIHRLTNSFASLSSPTLSDDGRKLSFAGYENGGWDVYLMREPFEYAITEPKEREDYDTRYTTVKKDYPLENEEKAGLNFSTDWAGGYLVFASGYGFQSLMEIALSDVLGNNRFYFAFDLYSRNILDSNFQLIYWYLPKRWDLGAAIFQEKNYFLVFPTSSSESIELVEETLRGGSLLLRLPLDKFHRFDLGTDIFTVQQTIGAYDSDGFWQEVRSAPYLLLVPSISWIKDTALWGYTGPVNGERWKFSFARSIPQIAKYSFDYSLFYGDIRNYKRITRGFSFATRLFGFSSWGEDALYYPLGGSVNVRGYDYYSFFGRKAGFMNLELRYPFIDRLKIRFPLPLDIQGIRGVTFCDIGGVTNKLREFKTAVKKQDGSIKLEDLKVGFGTGIRMNIGIAILKYDLGWHTNLESVSKMHMHFSLGSEF